MTTEHPAASVTPAEPAPAGRDRLTRRRFLQATATATAGAAATVPAGVLPGLHPAAQAAEAAAPGEPVGGAALSFTAATNGAATLHPHGDRLVAEVQNVLWSVPRDGGRATALTDPLLEPTRPQFSPDGGRLVVCAYRGGGFHLWTLHPDGSGLRQRTEGPWDDRAPAWSPDGTRIAFCSERGGDPVTGGPYRIWVLDVRSGELTRLTGRPGQQGPGQDDAWEDFDPTWSPDGRRVLFVRGAPVEGDTGPVLRSRTIASVAADGTGDVRTEHAESAEADVMTPAVSTGGRLAHLRVTAAPHATCTLVVDGKPVDVDGEVLAVPPRWVSADRLLLTVDGHFRIVSADAPADAERVPFTARLPVDRPRYRVKDYDFDAGGGPRPVRSLHLPALSPDGRRVAFAALNALWVADTAGGRPRKLLQGERTRYPMGPVWTPDGRAVVYADDRDGLFAVRRRDLDSGAETVLAEGGRVFPALSRDGRRLACVDMAGNIVVRDLPDGTERVVAAPLGAAGLPGRPSWSPDGRHLALCDRNRINQRFREGYNLVRVLDVDAEDPAAEGADRRYTLAPHASLSDRYDSGPVWSPDGRHLAVVHESALWLLPVRPDGAPDGEARRLTDEAADHPSWSADSGTLLYLSAGRLRRLAVRDGAADGPPRTVPVHLTYRRPKARDTVVHAGRLWDGTGEHVRDDVDVLVRDGRITGIAPHRAGRAAARHVDASDRTVLPGLWDAHTHPWQSTYGGRQTASQLAYGITTAVALGGFAYEEARVREAVAEGGLAGPRLLATGELLDGSRVAYSMGRAHATRDGLRRSLARAEGLDWDFVKTYVRAPGWIMAEAARFAHERLGVRSGSHLCTPGVQLGQDLTTHLQATQRLEFGHATTATGRTLEDVEDIYTGPRLDFHLIATPFTAGPLLGADPALADDPRVTRLMPPWDAEAVREAAAAKPTRDQLATLERETAFYRRVLARGGLVALGTDQPLVPVGLHLHLALRALHRAGLSAAEALRTATVLPARVFGADRDLGTVEEGKLADLTLVDGDPFTDFDTMVRTTAVLRGGEPFTQSELVSSFPAPTADPAPHPTSATPSKWHATRRQLRHGGCCDHVAV